MSVEVGCCPLCGGREHSPFERHEEASQELFYRLCNTCGMVFQSPRMSDEELAAFYISGYRSVVQGTETPTEKDLRVQTGRARNLVGFCHGVLPGISRHLDIGSSSGALLRAFARVYRCEGVGVEPGEAYRAIARARGTRVFADLGEIGAEQRSTFDLVSIIHVLEHIPDPVRYLTELRQTWVAARGYLLVEVPNLFGHQGTELSHLTVYAPRTLRQTLQASGFRVLKVRAHGRPRSPILALYLTALAQAAPNGHPAPRLRFSARGVLARRRFGGWVRETLTEKLPNWTWQEYPEPEEPTT